MTESARGWTTVIRPSRPWFDFELGDMWRYRDLALLLLRRDFVAQYKQTVLGPLWHVVNPVFTTLTYTLVFGAIAAPTDGVPAFAFYLAGTVIWNYFSRCVTATSNIFAVNAGVFGKVYFPRLIVPLAAVLSQLVAFAIQFTVFVVVLGYHAARGAPLHSSWLVLATPALLAITAAMSLGVGLIVSAVTTRYKDLTQLANYGMGLAMFVTPVVYPLSAVHGKLRMLVGLNPMTPIVEAFRLAFLGSGTVSAGGILFSGVAAAVLFSVGMIAFNRVERTSVDTI